METTQRSRWHGGGKRARGWAAITAGVLWVTAIAVSPLSAGPAQPGAAEPDIPTGGRYLEPVFDEVKTTLDVPYRETVDWQGNPVTLRLDIYEPVGDTASERPVNLIMSGGCFAYVDKGFIYGAGEGNARMGYVAVSIEYRTRGDFSLCDPLNADPDFILDAALDAYDDALAAVQWLRDHAEDYRIDPEAIIPTGGSAGANIAWNLAWLPGSDVRPEPSGVPAAVSVAGAPFPATPDPGDPPVLALHGTADSVIPIALAEDACTTAREVEVRCELVAYEGAGHFINDQVPILPTHEDDIGRRTAEFMAEEVLAPLGYFDDPPHGDPKPPPPDRRPHGDPKPSEPRSTEARELPKPAEPAPAIPGRPAFTG